MSDLKSSPDLHQERNIKPRVSTAIVLTLIFLCFVPLALVVKGTDLTLDEILQNLQTERAKTQDFYAETTTTITSSLKGMEKMVQKGRMWTKGKDKSKIEMLSPLKQVTITRGDKMAIIQPDSGQKIIKDLKKLREKSGIPSSSQSVNLEEMKKHFNLTLTINPRTESRKEQYIISGVPKKENKFLGKMEFYLDSEHWVPIKVLTYSPQNQLLSQSEIEYQEISGIWLPAKNISTVQMPGGNMKVEMGFSNVKVNQGLREEEFEVE